MKKPFSTLLLLNALAGYWETYVIIWHLQYMGKNMELDRSNWALGMLNLLLWGGYFLERWYAKKHAPKTWNVPALFVIPGIMINIMFLCLCGMVFGLFMLIS